MRQIVEFVFEPAFSVERTSDASETHENVARAVRVFVGRVELRMLADIPSWQYWLVDDVFGTLERWRNRPPKGRYAV